MRVTALKPRLKRLSAKGQRYVLRTKASAGKTRADIYYYRLKRDYLEAQLTKYYATERGKGVRVSEDIRRLSFGHTNGYWAHVIALAEFNKDPSRDIKEQTQILTNLANGFDCDSPDAMAYRHAMWRYEEAIESIESGDYVDMGEERLQRVFCQIAKDMPTGKHKRCGCG